MHMAAISENGQGGDGADQELVIRKQSTAAKRVKTKARVNKKIARQSAKATKRTGWATPPLNFPKNPLEEAIRLAQAIEEKYAGKPVLSNQIAKPLGCSGAEDPRLKAIVRSANLYGLVSGTGIGEPMKLEQIGADIVAPKTSEQRRKALMSAFRNVELFDKVFKYYEGKRIPEDEYFSNTLVREFSVPREYVDLFIKVFVENTRYLKAFSPDGEGKDVLLRVAAAHEPPPRDAIRPQVQPPPEAEGRVSLDTCFILMPFGEWYDRYYREVYIPATKEADFEPQRADGLFSTGTVIEQIWEQISKSKVLLADLTGKNANVFYELGLAHAICKPVILIAGNLEDVPFDLRHLRVIVYDIRDAHWGEKLRKSITAYLRSARKEPEKSIPQPFRAMRQAEESDQQVDEVPIPIATPPM